MFAKVCRRNCESTYLLHEKDRLSSRVPADYDRSEEEEENAIHVVFHFGVLVDLTTKTTTVIMMINLTGKEKGPPSIKGDFAFNPRKCDHKFVWSTCLDFL